MTDSTGQPDTRRSLFPLADFEPEPEIVSFGPGCFIPHDCAGKCEWAPWMQEAVA